MFWRANCPPGASSRSDHLYDSFFCSTQQLNQLSTHHQPLIEIDRRPMKYTLMAALPSQTCVHAVVQYGGSQEQ
jgi:hypothetical protein